MRIAVLLVVLAGCREPTRGPCLCTPENLSRTKPVGEAQPIDGDGLLVLLRRHQRLVAQEANRRDIKVLDDEIRLVTASFCQPCGDWVGDRATVEDMYPMSRLDDATHAVCLGLVLRDGSSVFGEARPQACRGAAR